MKTKSEKLAEHLRANRPETKSRPLGQALWLAVLFAHLGLATIQATPEVTAWHYSERMDVPSGLTNVVATAAGGTHSLALTTEGRVVAWGGNGAGQTNVPGGLSNVVAIAAGDVHSLALTAEGRVVAWGNNYAGQTDVPSGLSNVVGIAAGWWHNLALTAEGRVVAWGNSGSGETMVPTGLSNVVAIAAGERHSLALTAQGRVVAWGLNTHGQATVPNGLSNVVAIAAGSYHSLALSAEGRVVAWGQADMPNGLSNVVAIAAGSGYSLALTDEGRVVGWGNNWAGQAEVSSGLSNVVAIAAGESHNLALSGLPPGMAAPAWVGPRLLIATADRPFHHRITVKNGAGTFGAASLLPGLVLDPNTGLITGQPARAGKYSVVLSATNSMGSCAWTVTLFVNEAAAPGIVSRGLVLAGMGCGFNYPVVAYNVPEWYGASGLPQGLVMDAQSGVISGATVELGDFGVSLLVSNRSGLSTGSLTLRVSPVMGWGYNGFGQTTMPGGLSNVVAMAAGQNHSLALTAEGQVVAWGKYYYRTNWTDPAIDPMIVMTVPVGLSNVVAIAAAGGHSLALTAEGRVVAWGLYYYVTVQVLRGETTGALHCALCGRSVLERTRR